MNFTNTKCILLLINILVVIIITSETQQSKNEDFKNNAQVNELDADNEAKNLAQKQKILAHSPVVSDKSTRLRILSVVNDHNSDDLQENDVLSKILANQGGFKRKNAQTRRLRMAQNASHSHINSQKVL